MCLPSEPKNRIFSLALKANIQALDQRQMLNARIALLGTTAHSHQASRFLAKEELCAPKAARRSTLRNVQQARTARQEGLNTFKQIKNNALQALTVQKCLLPQFLAPWEPS